MPMSEDAMRWQPDEVFNDRRKEGRRTKPMTADELYEKHIAWTKGTEHEGNEESVAALRAHEKSGGLTRGQANKVADLAYIGGGDTDWRSQGHRDQ